MVLIPKGEGEYQNTGLVEVMWKVVFVIIDCQITSSIAFHNVLHCFRAGCGTRIATLDAKLLQLLVAMKEDVLYVIYMYLYKLYEALKRNRCLDILKVYGVER